MGEGVGVGAGGTGVGDGVGGVGGGTGVGAGGGGTGVGVGGGRSAQSLLHVHAVTPSLPQIPPEPELG